MEWVRGEGGQSLQEKTTKRSALTFRIAPLFVGIFLLAAPWLVYHRVGQFDFVTFDDGLHVYSNPYLNPPTLKSVAAFWTAPYKGLYVPLTYSVWALQAKFSGKLRQGNSASLNPKIFHLVNVGFHSANTLLLFLILRTLGLAIAPALFAALLFAWHPLQVEPVTWISSLKDLLSGFFVLLAIWQALVFSRSDEKNRTHYFVALGCFLLGLFAKPSALVFPLLVGVLEVGILGRPWQKSLKAWGPCFLIAIPFAWITKEQQPDAFLEYVTPWFYRPMVAADAILFYLSKLVFPLFLTLNYGRSADRVVAATESWGALLILAFALLLIYRRKERVVWFTAVALFVGYLFPVLGFLPFYFQKFSTVADRFMYLAFLGPCLALGWWLSRGGNWRYTLTVLMLSFFALRSYSQTSVWRDSHHFIRQVGLMNPHDPDVHYGLAILFSEESQLPGQGTFYSQMLRLKPQERDEASRLRREAQAIYHYQEAIRINPKHAFAHNNLGMIYFRTGNLTEAIKNFKRAIEIEPLLVQAHNNLGVALAEMGSFQQAISAFEAAMKVVPSDEKPLLNLAMAHESLGEISEAKKYFSQVLAINKAHPVARQRLANLTASQH